MKCPECGRELESGANFCPDCGTRVLFEKQPQQNPSHYSATNVLSFGTTALLVSLFLERTIAVVALIFGVLAVLSGIKLLKTPLFKKALLGMTFGILGIIFGLVFSIQLLIQFRTLKNLNPKMEEGFSLTIPERKPDAMLFYFERFDEVDYWANEYHYFLSEEEFEALDGQDLDWLPYEESELVKHFANLLGIKLGTSICLDKSEGVTDPDQLEDAEEYRYTAVIFDQDNSKLIIMEIWK